MWLIVIIGFIFIVDRLDTIIEKLDKLDQLYTIIDVLNTIDRKNTKL